jgi:DNA (cytosine-5)-methyltransferase 1
VNLCDVVCAELLSTPTACNANDGETVISSLGRRARQQPSRAMPLSVAVRLLPTPRASDGIKGSSNQHGSRGDLTLPSAAINLPQTAAVAWGAYELAIGRWGTILGRPAP